MAESVEKMMNLNNQKKNMEENQVEKVIKEAERHLGTKYVYGGESEKGIDCSYLVQKAYRAAGKELPRVAMDQAKKGEKILTVYDPSKLKRGDLIFFKNTSNKRKKGEVTHVGIYLGNEEMIHASSSKGVIKSKIEKYYKEHFHSATRVLVNEKDMKNTEDKSSIKKGSITSENTLTEYSNEIVKAGPERFEKIFEYLLKVEGGYSNHKNDKGGPTKYGIIEKEARRYGYKGDMRNFPKDMAKMIYEKDYYKKNRLDEVKDDRIALSICDWAVNSGSSRAVKKAQAVLNEMGYNLAVDGIIGSRTLEALNGANSEEFLEAYHKSQGKFYDNIVKRDPSQKEFQDGWHNRIKRKEDFIKNEMTPNLRKSLSEVKEQVSSQAKTAANQQKTENTVQRQR